MKFTTSINFNVPIEKVFEALKNPAIMQRVAWPLVVFKPVKPVIWPAKWEEGKIYKINMYLLGFLPMGWQELKITTQQDPAQNIFALYDSGPGWAVKWWNHKVELTKVSEIVTNYKEELNLTAGLLTPVIWLGMKVLFKWRQYRWGKITF